MAQIGALKNKSGRTPFSRLARSMTPRNLKGPTGAAPIRGARLYFQDLVFFLAFFFFAMTLFLGFADEVRQGWLRSRA
jgi:hypothetical protein